MLKTKSILAPIEISDGIRISIMSKHTLNDGITPDSRINYFMYSFWFPSLAPPSKLVGEYYKNNLPWGEYEKRYFEYIRQASVQTTAQNIARVSLRRDITLLCIEDTPKQCHRRLLAEECKRYEPSLALSIL